MDDDFWHSKWINMLWVLTVPTLVEKNNPEFKYNIAQVAAHRSAHRGQRSSKPSRRLRASWTFTWLTNWFQDHRILKNSEESAEISQKVSWNCWGNHFQKQTYFLFDLAIFGPAARRRCNRWGEPSAVGSTCKDVIATNEGGLPDFLWKILKH